jgi:adenylate kinase
MPNDSGKPADSSNRLGWLHGNSEPCIPLSADPLSWKLVLLGPPGAGKGTQADLLSQKLGACHLSTGDLFRAAALDGSCAKSPALTAALAHMRKGELVPDATVWKMVRERSQCLRCRGGFLLDGFPRTVMQARALNLLLQQEGLAVDAVIDYELSEAEIVARLSGRRTCEDCQAIFNVSQRPPRMEGHCDHCGGRLIHRDDDKAEAITVRLKDYRERTSPLIEFYNKAGLLIPVAASGSAEEIFVRTMQTLKVRSAEKRAP